MKNKTQKEILFFFQCLRLWLLSFFNFSPCAGPLVKITPTYFSDASGSIAGTTFSKNAGGLYLRKRVKPTNPQSDDQAEQRNFLAQLSQAWRGLSQSERQTWISCAKDFPYSNVLGITKTLSGFGLYVQLNLNLLIISEPTVDECPSASAVESISTLSLNAAAPNNLSITFTPTPIPAGHKWVIEATPQVSTGISFVKNKYRRITVLAAATISPQNVFAAWQAKFGGSLVVGNKVFVRAHSVLMATGQVSTNAQAFAEVV